MDKLKKITIALSTSLLVLVLGWFGCRFYAGGLLIDQVKADRQYASAKKDYQKQLAKITREVYLNGANSKSPKLQALATLNGNQAILQGKATQFFKVYYTFDGSKAYEARVNKLAPLMTDDLKKNQALFGGDKDASGNNVVNVLGLTANFEKAQAYVESADNNTVKGLIVVNYTAGYQGSTPGTGTQTYETTYDKKQAKFTQMDLISTGIVTNPGA